MTLSSLMSLVKYEDDHDKFPAVASPKHLHQPVPGSGIENQTHSTLASAPKENRHL